MKCLILAGGSGDRLWPLSRRSYPKQFVEIKENYDGTLLIISHQERILNIADEIIVIANGVVKDIGKKEEILPTLLEVSNIGDCCLNGGNN